MAGRGTDIRLGEGVAELGGLYVIGTQKHESRRIDNQLRGRAGRQGDPGSSRFFVSLEDDLMVKYGDLNPDLGKDPDTVQRLVEGQNLDARFFSKSTSCRSRASAITSTPIARKFWRARPAVRVGAGTAGHACARSTIYGPTIWRACREFRIRLAVA